MVVSGDKTINMYDMVHVAGALGYKWEFNLVKEMTMSKSFKKLDKAAQVHADMMSLINICKSNTGSLDLWGVYWDPFGS